MLKEFHLLTASLNPNASEELQAPAQASGSYRNHNGEAREFVRPELSEEVKAVYRRHFSEEWFAQKTAEWKMHEYIWDDDQFLFPEKEVKGNYAFINDKKRNK